MEIQLFNGFIITYHTEKINFAEYISKQSLALLEILILHYDKVVSANFLMDMLWEESGNPKNALKFSIYRLRKLLNQISILQSMNLIRTEKGGYRFKVDIPCLVDCDEFEKLYATLPAEGLYAEGLYKDEHIMNAAKLTNLYRGALYNNDENIWFTQKVEYYRSSYLKVVQRLCEYYLLHEHFENLKVLSLKAATLEPSVEENHFYYIQALMHEQDYNKAFEYYQKSTRMLVSEYAVMLSEKMKNLYNNLVDNNDERKNIDAITDYYKIKSVTKGAFYCDNIVFDYLFELRLRNAQRDCTPLFLAIFDIQTQCESDERQEILQEKAKECIRTTLRSGDAFTKLNKYQFIVLLLCPTEDQAYKVVQRVSKAFQKKVRHHQEERLNYHVKVISE